MLALSRRIALVLTGGLLAASPAGAATPQTASAADFEAAIARLEQRDPQDPQALNARLQYAGFLTDSATDAKGGAKGGDCHARLDAAQAQLDAVVARHAALVVLPLGPAQLQGGAYNIHAARADCDAASREQELNKALDAARGAARAYRDGLDYQSAAIMQFNIAATLHALGDNDAAITALQTTIATDREFGFRDDAEDNIRTLQHWQGGDESDAKIAELMKDFPARTAEFKFAWAESDALMDITATETNLTGGDIVQSTGQIALQRTVRHDRPGWAVHYDTSAKANLDLGRWPASPDILLQRFSAYLLTLAVLETPDYSVNLTGDFDAVKNPDKFSAALSAEIAGSFGTAVPVEGANAGTSKALAQNLKTVLKPGFVEAITAQKHALETATWAGAKLEQGAWYQMQAPLLLPGLVLGQYFLVTHDIAFSYARQVACTHDDTAKSCAEIVIHATPEPKDMARAHVEMSSMFHMPNFDALHYWSSIDMRLVVKPATLEPAVSDMRKSWYAFVDGSPKFDPAISSERVVTTMSYH